MNDLMTIELDDLERAQGGSWVSSFVRGFTGGAIHGPTARYDQIEIYGDPHATGFKPGVETGMMFNMALGPVGRMLSLMGKALPPKR